LEKDTYSTNKKAQKPQRGKLINLEGRPNRKQEENTQETRGTSLFLAQAQTPRSYDEGRNGGRQVKAAYILTKEKKSNDAEESHRSPCIQRNPRVNNPKGKGGNLNHSRRRRVLRDG